MLLLSKKTCCCSEVLLVVCQEQTYCEMHSFVLGQATLCLSVQQQQQYIHVGTLTLPEEKDSPGGGAWTLFRLCMLP